MDTRTKMDGRLLRPWLVPRVRPADLARKAGVSRQYVDHVLSGRKPPSRKLIEAADSLGIPTNVIYGADE